MSCFSFNFLVLYLWFLLFCFIAFMFQFMKKKDLKPQTCLADTIFSTMRNCSFFPHVPCRDLFYIISHAFLLSLPRNTMHARSEVCLNFSPNLRFDRSLNYLVSLSGCTLKSETTDGKEVTISPVTHNFINESRVKHLTVLFYCKC